ncbi:MAG: hypothetical protein ACK4SF_04025 [Algoriphagus aquaeductus]|uniref:hypothetical protein n=1 Tax=Algoriphagus aquaeductus TaxID=475299 RepID=UPI00391BC644
MKNIILIITFTIFIHQIKIPSQTLAKNQYKVIHDLFISESSILKFPLYFKVKSDSVFDLIGSENPKTTNLIPGGVNRSDYIRILEGFQSEIKRHKLIHSNNTRLEKDKINKHRKITNKLSKGMIISRPLISKEYCLIYFKTPGENFEEGFLLGRFKNGTWEFYGKILIEMVLNDPLIK